MPWPLMRKSLTLSTTQNIPDNMKVSQHFKRAIQKKLYQMAEDDFLFANSLTKKNKSMDACIAYILAQVKKIGAVGYTDDEIYGMAAHYFDEDDLEKFDPVSCHVVVNHKPELTPEEVEELKKKARDEILLQEKNRLRSKPKPVAPAEPVKSEQPSLF